MFPYNGGECGQAVDNQSKATNRFSTTIDHL